MTDSDYGGGPVGPTFFAMQVNERTCQRCGADYTAHGSRLECPAWAFERKLKELEEKKEVSDLGFGYAHMMTLAMAVPWSGRPLPPELPMAFKSCIPAMNTNTVMLETRGQPIDQARNFFAEKALELNAKYLFFWDEDVLLPAHALRELIYLMENWPNVGVAAGIYCLKVDDHPQPLVFKGTGAGVYWDWKVGEVFECTATGMGCTLIRTEVFKDLPKPWFKTVDNFEPYLDNLPHGETWTEDLYFARKIVEQKKWKIVAHGGLVMPHLDVRTGKYYELPPDSKPAKHLQLPVGKKKILDIGAGPNPLKTQEGKVITCDIRDNVGADYRCDVRKVPFASGEFDIVYSSHCLEHFPRAQTSSVLDEWIRVLKPEGELRLVVPNIQWAAKKILADDFSVVNAVGAMDVLYAQQAYDEDFHKNGFTPKSLEQLLRSKGFNHFIVETPSFHIFMRAWKKKPKEITKTKLLLPPEKKAHANGKHA